MASTLDISQRRREPEVMDDPALDEAAHREALRVLARINALSRSAAALWGPIRQYVRAHPGRPFRLLDVACGGGDVTLLLRRKAQLDRLPVTVAGCDLSPTALAYARGQARAAEADVNFFACNAVRDALPGGYDIAVSSLFLHHLDEADVVTVLRRMAAGAELVVVNDLVRSRLGLGLAMVGARVLSRSPVVRVDGPRSVRGALTPEELAALAAKAGLTGATVRRVFPCRMLLCWRRA